MRKRHRPGPAPRSRPAIRRGSTRAVLDYPRYGWVIQDGSPQSGSGPLPAGPRTRRLRASVRGDGWGFASGLALAFALRLDAERLAGDVERAVLRVLGYAPDVLADDSKRQHLDAAEEEDRRHQRRPALEGGARGDVVDDHVDAEREREERHDHAEVRDQPQRRVGERDEGVDRGLHELAARPFRLAGVALRAVVRDLRLREAGPADDPEGQPVALGEAPERLDDRAVDQAEAAGAALRDGRQREAPDEAVEGAGQRAA